MAPLTAKGQEVWLDGEVMGGGLLRNQATRPLKREHMAPKAGSYRQRRPSVIAPSEDGNPGTQNQGLERRTLCSKVWTLELGLPWAEPVQPTAGSDSPACLKSAL